MTRVKGCVNEKCVAYKNKVNYKESEEYCSKCGVRLSYVCKAKKDDKKDEFKKGAVAVGGALLAVGGVVLTKGKEIAKHIYKQK